MGTFFHTLGWMFLGIAFVFMLGLIPAFTRHIYPKPPRVTVRAVAPILFAMLAIACFAGKAIVILSAVAFGGSLLILASRKTCCKES